MDYDNRARQQNGRTLDSLVNMNTLMVIHPYKYQGQWVFDDDRVDLIREPFIAGADAIIDHMVKNIADAESGFRLVFSAVPFPGHDAALERRREDAGGHWYWHSGLNMEGWLCPALFKYFEEAPDYLYAKFEPKAV